MRATACATSDGATAASGRLSSVATSALELVWPMYLTVVFALGAWVLIPVVVLGWRPVTIISGSMAPVVQPGYVVVIEPYGDQQLRPGAVVTYRDAELDRLVTHRIASVHTDGTITTKGDANDVDDPTALTSERIVGVAKLVVPAAGLPALWAHQGRTELVAVVAVLPALAAGSAARAASEATRSARPRPSRRREGRRHPGARGIGLALASVALTAVLGGTALSRAAFVGAQHNTANSFGAATITAPTGVTATAKCELILLNAVPRIELAWHSVASADGYQVFRSENVDSGYVLAGTTTSSTYEDTSVEHGKTYHYRVRTIDGSWQSGDSATASATVSATLVCI